MRSENRAGSLLLLPMGLLLTLLALVPIAGVLGLSLQKRMPIFQISEFVGLANYRFLLSDPRFWSALKNTLLFTAASVSLELAIGLGIALLLQRGSRLGPVRAVVLIPWVIPTVVTAKMWEWIYHPGFGLLNYLLETDINWLGDPRWAMPAAIVADVWKTAPFAVILFVAGLQAIPRDLYLAARVDGASGLQIFRSITLPLLKPVILIVLLFRTLDAFRVFDTIYVLTGGGPANTTETLSIYAYKVLFQILEFGYGSALAVATFFAVMMISLIYIRILKRRPE